ncbi:MAG: antibiotic biosynthesis monooxygenase [Hyphomicrobiales bacterium]|nr:antibiotic biosynthesis monooxygenase [Hyphomicrobiales bacterium]
MVTKALYVRLEAKPGLEAKVEEFLCGALPLVEAEPATKVWFATKMGPMTYGIFDAFPDDAGRDAHLMGKVADALRTRAEELFRVPPQIEKIDVIAAKLP